MKLYIARLIKCANYDEYVQVRLTIPEGIIEVMKILGGFNWELIEKYEEEYQEFVKWFENIELN